AAKTANRPTREQDWSLLCQPLRLPRKRSRQRGSRRLRRPDPARRHRRCGFPASCRRPSVGADPVTKTLPRGGGGPGRGSTRCGNRGANCGPRGPLKGGQRGRWGRW
ncbi:MAG: hypothetical protein ACK559_14825, partial [bacterium]